MDEVFNLLIPLALRVVVVWGEFVLGMMVRDSE
jgi:hypothetical protein